VASWSVLTSRARLLLCIARDPGVRLRDSRPTRQHRAQRLRHRHRPDRADYVAKQKDGRRNRYQIQAHLPLPEPASQESAIGGVLALLAGARARLQLTGTGPA
jgi:hypothetical protein